MTVAEVDRTAKSVADKTWRASALAVLLAFGVGVPVMFATPILNDADTFWQRMIGEWMLQHHQLMREDPFTYTHAGGGWVAPEWIGDLLIALAYRASGWAGVMALTGLAVGATIGLLAKFLAARISPLATVVAIALVATCLAPSMLARPHVLVWPLTALWMMVLIGARDRGVAPSPWWALLLWLWANMHGSFVLGLALIGPFALEALTDPRGDRRAALIGWGRFGLLALVGGIATPQGAHGVVYPFVLMATPSTYHFITEWRSADFSTLTGLELALIVTIYVCITRGVRVPPLRALLLLGMLHLALSHVRHGPLLAIVGALVLAAPLAAIAPALHGDALTRSQRWRLGVIIVVAAILATGLRVSQPVVLMNGPSRPMAVVDQVGPEIRAQRVFNEFTFGGYLIEAGVRPFIDGRTDMFDPKVLAAHNAAVIQNDTAALARALETYQVRWTLLEPGSAAAVAMDRAPGWRRVAADRYAVAHVRTAP